MQIISHEQNLKLSGRFDKPTAHQLVLEGCAGFVTGAIFANGDTSRHDSEPVIVDRKSIFVQIDGGGVLVSGETDLVFEDCIFQDNTSIMCGGGVSLQAMPGSKIVFRNCQFLRNLAADTGAAIDLLTPGLNVLLENCTFDENITNRWTNVPRGHVSVFPGNHLQLMNCTFQGKALDVDYHGESDIKTDSDRYRIRNVSGLKNTKVTSKALTIARAWLQHPAYLPRV